MDRAHEGIVSTYLVAVPLILLIGVAGLATPVFGNSFALQYAAAWSPSTGGVLEDPVIAAAGDIACDPADPSYNGGLGTTTTCRMKYTSDLLVNLNPAAVFTLGDNEQSDGALWKLQQSYDPTWGRVKSIIHPAVGNHEYGTPGASGYFSYFGAAAGDPSKGYYSFDIRAWHIVVLNGNCDKVGGCAAGSSQEQWLKADLAASPASCTLAYWHQPRFSSGGHGDNLAYDVWWQDLYSAGADVVLNGHDHYYERFAPQNPSGIADQVYGIREFVVGTGGRSHSSFGSIHSTSEVRNSDTFGVLELTLRSDSYSWQFIPEAGRTFTDSGTHACHPISIGSYGDSITHGFPYGTSDPLEATDRTFPSVLQKTLDSQFGVGNRFVVNHGINGLKAEELATILQTQGWLNENPTVASIMIGGNDLAAGRTPQQTLAAVQASVNIIKAHINPDGHPPVILVSAFPPNLLGVSANNVIISYNTLLNDQLTNVDMFFSENFYDLYDPETGQAKPELMYDSVHPNDAGYQVIAQNWYKAVQDVTEPGTWSSLSGLTPDATTLAVSSDRLYVAARSLENGIWYRSMDGSGTWSGWNALPGLTDVRPAVAVLNDRLYFVCKEARTSRIWYGYYSLSAGVVSGSFSGWTLLPGPTPVEVSLAADSSYLYVAAVAPDGTIWHRRMDASGGWSGWTRIPGLTDVSPAIAIFNNRLYFACKEESTNNIWYGYVDLASYPNGWSGWTFLPGPTPDALTLTASSDTLYLAARGMENGIWYRGLGASGPWSGWSHVLGSTDARPAIAVFNAQLRFVCKEASSNNIWYC